MTSRYRVIAASTSPAETGAYLSELGERCRGLSLHYRRVLELIRDDLAAEDSSRLPFHLDEERNALRKLTACIRTMRALAGDQVALPLEYDGLTDLQAVVMRGLKARSSVLRERIKNGTLSSRKRRIFGGDAAFIDISC